MKQLIGWMLTLILLAASASGAFAQELTGAPQPCWVFLKHEAVAQQRSPLQLVQPAIGPAGLDRRIQAQIPLDGYDYALPEALLSSWLWRGRIHEALPLAAGGVYQA